MTEAEAKAAIETVLQTVTFREREILKLRVPMFGDGWLYTFKDIGTIFKITPSRASAIHRRTMKKLKHPKRAALLVRALRVLGYDDALETMKL